jgi:hypothetical protein
MLARYGFVTPLGATPATSSAIDNVSIAVPLVYPPSSLSLSKVQLFISSLIGHK